MKLSKIKGTERIMQTTGRKKFITHKGIPAGCPPTSPQKLCGLDGRGLRWPRAAVAAVPGERQRAIGEKLV